MNRRLLWPLLLLAVAATACSGEEEDGGANGGTGGGSAAGGSSGSPEPPPPGVAQARGYTSRACGFDLDDDGAVGEPEDDCQVCDGETSDPDSDGVDEDLIYVDCNAASNDTSDCGAPSQPCSSIAHAWNVIADGPDDGAEDIICFRGTCLAEDNTTPGVAGLEEHRVEPRSATEVRDFQIPTNPTMLVGWDTDDDGEYPPFDSDDEAVLDGGPNRLERAFTGLTRFIEFAHFVARDYGRYNDGDHGGFMELKRGSGGPSTHVHLHDLSLENINMDRQSVSGRIVFDYFGGTTVKYLLVRNVSAINVGPWFVRGSGPFGDREDDGPLRWQNLSLTAHVCDHSGPEACPDVDQACHTGWKVWGYVSGIEILDSVFDANPGPWIPKTAGGPPTNFVVACQCSRDWAVRNNEILNYKEALVVQGHSDGYCDEDAARTVDNVLFDSNYVRNDYAEWSWGQQAIILTAGGDRVSESVEDVTITNNFLSSINGFEGCFFIASGNSGGPQPGTITIVNNTCVAEQRRFGALVVGNADGSDFPFMPQSYVIRNNIFAAIGSGNLNVHTTYEPSDWDADHNVFDADAGFQWSAAELVSLADWSATSGGDANSLTCAPAFADADVGDLHLADSDDCARSAGAVATSATQADVDGEARPQGDSWDIGADEVE